MYKICKSINIHNSQKMKFSIKDFFSKKSLRENFIFCAMSVILELLM